MIFLTLSQLYFDIRLWQWGFTVFTFTHSSRCYDISTSATLADDYYAVFLLFSITN